MDFLNTIDFEKIVPRSIKEILLHEDFPSFLLWMRKEMGVSPQLSLLSSPADHIGPMATWFAVALWNCTPLPGNDFQPKPISIPGRNQPCICGSGKKFKRCCSVGEHNLPPMDENMIWPLLFDAMPAKILNKALKTGTLPLNARVFYCAECLEGDNPDKVIRLLKDYYFAESWKHTGEHAAYGLTLLFDALDRLGMLQMKMDLIEHICNRAPSSPLRSEALQRLATIQADSGDLPAAFATLKKAQKDTPHDPAVGVLEVQLLLVKGDPAKARQRALFIAGQIRRLHRHIDESLPDPMLDFLNNVIENPEAATAMMAGGPPLNDSELTVWLDKHRSRPVVPCDFEEMEGFAEDDEFNPASDRPHFMVRSLPQLRKVETSWRKVCPVEPLFGVQLYSFDELDPWYDEEFSSWKDFLLTHLDALDSIVIIDDLLTICTLHPSWMQPYMMADLFEPILSRGLDLVEKSLERLPAQGCLPWLVTENRPLLRILVREVVSAYTEDENGGLIRAQQLLELNPGDNHGFRRDLINQHLVAGADEKALAMTERYPDDIMAEILYGRVLALYRLGRREEAEAAASTAKQRLPRVASFLVSPQRKEPEENSPYGIISGGRREAWEYREEMRLTWKATRGILTWLKNIK